VRWIDDSDEQRQNANRSTRHWDLPEVRFCLLTFPKM
jgi:hypothetical protein